MYAVLGPFLFQQCAAPWRPMADPYLVVKLVEGLDNATELGRQAELGGGTSWQDWLEAARPTCWTGN